MSLIKVSGSNQDAGKVEQGPSDLFWERGDVREFSEGSGCFRERIINVILMTCCKWPMILRLLRWIRLAPAWVAILWSAVNILYYKLALYPSGFLISTCYTCMSSSHCSQCAHMLRPVITAECLQSSHINTCVKQHGVPSWVSLFLIHNLQFWPIALWHLSNYWDWKYIWFISLPCFFFNFFLDLI